MVSRFSSPARQRVGQVTQISFGIKQLVLVKPLAFTVQVRDKRQNAHTIFAQTRVKKRVRKCAFTCIYAHFIHMFPFVIHSHNCALCGILLYNRKQNKRQFPQTPLKGCLRRQSNTLPIGLYNHITEQMENKFEFSYIWFYKS